MEAWKCQSFGAVAKVVILRLMAKMELKYFLTVRMWNIFWLWWDNVIRWAFQHASLSVTLQHSDLLHTNVLDQLSAHPNVIEITCNLHLHSPCNPITKTLLLVTDRMVSFTSQCSMFCSCESLSVYWALLGMYWGVHWAIHASLNHL